MITVTDAEVRFLKNNKTHAVSRDQVHVAFLDGKNIVLQDASSRELVREPHDQLKSEVKAIPAAFKSHGYPWSDDGDPHRGAFRRWVEDTPDLPGAVNALLRARAKALDAGGKGRNDARELRDEVAKLGFVVRDEESRQYWRSVSPV
ncbi:MAG: CysS/YqeB C-terminal domain-containing protein [Nocardioidaceae bacterium]